MSTSWINVAEDNDFPIQNIPFGICDIPGKGPIVCSRIGDFVIDLQALHTLNILQNKALTPDILKNEFLNDFIDLGKPLTNAVRLELMEIFDVSDSRHASKQRAHFLIPIDKANMKMPIFIRDYTDFYSSEDHARNVGTMFRDPDNALLPNWKHLPVAYHGRASSIVVSGTDVKRPSGQTIPANSSQPVFGPSKLVDFELEMGFVVGKGNKQGLSISTDDAAEHIFGLVLFNDWSARDIQKWEYIPLGPFLAKNFASTISPWIITMEALEDFKVDGPVQDPEVLPYLRYQGTHHYDIQLDVLLGSKDFEATLISRSNYKYMYWNMAQQLAHHTVSGCNMNVGDVCASGTISGPTPSSYGSMLELSWRGTKPITMPDGTERKFIQDGDELILRGYAQGVGYRVGFGEAKGLLYS